MTFVETSITVTRYANLVEKRKLSLWATFYCQWFDFMNVKLFSVEGNRLAYNENMECAPLISLKNEIVDE